MSQTDSLAGPSTEAPTGAGQSADPSTDDLTGAERRLACMLALLSLPQMGPSRVAKLLDLAPADKLWNTLRTGDPNTLGSPCQELAKQAEVSHSQLVKWCQHAQQIEPEQQLAAYQTHQVAVAELNSPGYPDRLAQDIEPPALLFWQGQLDILNRHPTAAIVGTRSCSNYGRQVAFELGQSLAAAGVAVVSGLAVGIDTAAHKGALSAGGAPPVGVVASGLNKVYPKSNSQLWEAVATTGLLLSETPLDIAPERWRFPARNRIIAALADVVVIVESLEKGGALFTAEEAAQRAKPVFAVPGPIRSAASYGTNRLLAEGCLPLCDANDVLVALGVPVSASQADPVSNQPVGTKSSKSAGAKAATSATMSIAELTSQQQQLLEVFDWQPAGLDQLVERSGMSLGEVALCLDDLQAVGHVIRRGLWYERQARQ